MLILPCPQNCNKPPVRSFVLRQRGAKTGIRLIDWQSLRAYIRATNKGKPHKKIAVLPAKENTAKTELIYEHIY